MAEQPYQAVIGVGSVIVGATLVAPLERVKLLLQCQNEMIRTQRLGGPYKGIINCTKTTISNEGFWALWRGNVIFIARKIPAPMLNFAVHALMKDVDMLKIKQTDSLMMRATKNVTQGVAAGSLSLVVLYSLDYCHNRLACDTLSGEKEATRQFTGIRDVYRKTLASDGPVGLYRGFTLACFGIAVYRGLYFGLYDTMKPVILGHNNKNLLAMFTFGYGVTITAGMLSYPIDTVRRRMMMRSCEPVKYAGALDCARYILRNEGFMSFMKGFGVNLLKGCLGAAMLVGYDSFKSKF